MSLDAKVPELTQRLNELPIGARALIYSAEVDSTLLSIGSKHNLHVDQIGDLKSQVLFLIAGITPREDFVKKLMNRLEIEDEIRVQAIAQDVDTLILVPIREKMKTLKPADGGVASSSTPAPAQTTLPAAIPSQPPAAPTLQAPPIPPTPPITNTPSAAPIAVTAPITPKPVSVLGSALDSAMAKPQSTPVARVDVGIAAPTPAKPTYKVDPYRELPQ